MTATAPTPTRAYPARPPPARGSRLLLRTTDHKMIGQLYVVTAFGFFMAAGAMAMLMRAELALPSDGFTTLNMISSIGAFVLGASTLPLLWNVFRSYRYGEKVTVEDPWGYGNSLEWATTCPPPRHNFTELPRIRSERPAFELHYPHGGADAVRGARLGAPRRSGSARAVRDRRSGNRSG